ncbi:MAG: hypothetical protein J6T76_05865 [Paludibacteraceae bacterium]|nr:hypothetical protein [Paludibacteraceae bacterium]
MNAIELQQLLGRYYSGETTVQEEQMLKEYFSQSDIPSEFLADQLAFCSQTCADIEMPQEVHDRLLTYIEQFEPKMPNRLISMKQPPRKIVSVKKLTKLWRTVAAVVVLLLCIGGGFFKSYNENANFFPDTCTTTEEALQALMLANEIFTSASRQSRTTINEALEGTDDIMLVVNTYINF